MITPSVCSRVVVSLLKKMISSYEIHVKYIFVFIHFVFYKKKEKDFIIVENYFHLPKL